MDFQRVALFLYGLDIRSVRLSSTPDRGFHLWHRHHRSWETDISRDSCALLRPAFSKVAKRRWVKFANLRSEISSDGRQSSVDEVPSTTTPWTIISESSDRVSASPKACRGPDSIQRERGFISSRMVIAETKYAKPSEGKLASSLCGANLPGQHDFSS